MDVIDNMKSSEVIKRLKTHKKYKSKNSQQIKDKLGDVAHQRKELKRLNLSHQPDMSLITRDQVEFYSQLDLIDLMNLCHTNKNFHQICHDNTLLKQILHYTVPNLKLPTNYDFVSVINSLYTDISQYVLMYYDTDIQYPKWINYELLVENMKRKILIQIANHIKDMLEDYNHNYEDDEDYLAQIGLFPLETKSTIAFPFFIQDIDFNALSNNYQVNRAVLDNVEELTLSDNLKNFLKMIFKQWKKQDYKYIPSLLFIRDYSYDK